MSIDVEAVRAAAGSTRDPEIRRSLAELGLLDEVQIEGSQVTVHFHLTSPLCPSKFATTSEQQGIERVILLALIGSGLRLAELLRLRRRDVGSLDSEGRLIPDMEADPLAVQYTPRRGNQRECITFLTYATRQVLLVVVAGDTTQQAPTQPLDLDGPLIAQRDGSRATRASVARARRRSQSLIRAGSEVNVTLCQATGDFFREWGLPGSRFVGPEELPLEEYL